MGSLLKKLAEENKASEERVATFKSGGIQLVTEEVLQKTADEQVYYARNWKKLKRGCSEMVDTITEAIEMNTREFRRGVGIETDEDFKVDLKAFKT